MRLGIDLGGTKISGLALDQQGRTLARCRSATPRGDYAATLEAIAAIVARLEAETGRRGSVGVAIPGTVSSLTGLVKNANSTWLIGEPLDRDLAERLDRPVRVENDANCFALSEATDGAGAGAPTVFGVILGTGVGGGLVVEGRPLPGRDGIAGEWGHNPLPWPQDDERPGPPCYCGRRGCVETFLSGPALAREAGAGSGEAAVLAAEAGEPRAQAALARYVERLGRGLAHVINIFDPHVVVLGGGLSELPLLYREVPPRLAGWVFSDRPDTPIRAPRFGADSGVRGAAWLWREEELAEAVGA
ncbi:fructokinase [Tistlia consotensis]|uniref:Fructokinase n=1 Tax=Tistlia consotensis USBA 355 TaxID=560819 RepID=A0A1Y6BUF5_9PROT|nr:ROK family protein [Tistlia consotensis]SMF20808.1 fructokinase [Tistlia consotensis USBA 355]SNR47517.1 fructokinase [Tistlia consotensis]